MRSPTGFPWARVLVALAFAALAPACPANESAVARHNLVVVAPDRDSAETVALEVERAAERFHRAFGLSLTDPSPGPVIVVQVGVVETTGDGEGALLLASSEDGAKIHLRWGLSPLRREAVARGTLRALALRHALRNGARAASDVPAWVLDGVAMLATSPEVADVDCSRAALLARFAPRLGIEGALGLLGGRALGPDVRRGLAGALLSDAAASPAARARLLSTMPAFGVDPAAALAEVLGRGDLDAWWTEWWRGQGSRLPPLRLGWTATRLWILGWEKDEDAAPASEASIAPVASPWFAPWFAAPPTVDPSSLEAIRRAIERRRAESLEWFDAISGTGFATRGEWLAEGLRGAADGQGGTGPGPAQAWFRALPMAAPLPNRTHSPSVARPKAD